MDDGALPIRTPRDTACFFMNSLGNMNLFTLSNRFLNPDRFVRAAVGRALFEVEEAVVRVENLFPVKVFRELEAVLEQDSVEFLGFQVLLDFFQVVESRPVFVSVKDLIEPVRRRLRAGDVYICKFCVNIWVFRRVLSSPREKTVISSGSAALSF